jgi:hypothetical protein
LYWQQKEDLLMSKSEVATCKERLALEEQAARNGLYGLATVASHETITARMEIGAQRILKLFEEGKPEEAVALMSTNGWGE